MAVKITSTTGNRGQDADWNRIYSLVTDLQNRIDALEAPSTTPTPVVPNILPLPNISPATTVSDVEASPVVGILTSYAREDHVHDGVRSLGVNNISYTQLFGDVTLTDGVGILMTQTGNNIMIQGTANTLVPTKIAFVNSPYHAAGNEGVIFANTAAGAISIILPNPASFPGWQIIIMNTGTTNSVSVGAAAGTVINITTLNNVGGHTAVSYVSDGSNWYSFMNSTGN